MQRGTRSERDALLESSEALRRAKYAFKLRGRTDDLI